MKRLNVKFHLLVLLFVLKFNESTQAELTPNEIDTSTNRKQVTLVSLWRIYPCQKKLRFSKKSSFELLTIAILLAGDIESNPGPDQVKRAVPELDQMLQMKGIKIFHQNIRGLSSKFSHLEELLSDFPKIDILGLSETHLEKSLEETDFCSIENYDMIKKNQSIGTHGGVALYISDRVKYKRRKDLERERLECIWIEIIETNVRPFLLGCIYRPPDTSDYFPPDFDELFQNNLTNNMNQYREVIVMGDFNINYLVRNDHKEQKQFLNLQGFDQLISKPTRITDTSTTLIDLTLTNDKSKISHETIIPLSLSDHEIWLE